MAAANNVLIVGSGIVGQCLAVGLARRGIACQIVEIKESSLGRDVKAGHFSYIGDATVGDGANIGAGAVTANYDGDAKHRTEIGENALAGPDTVLVAPVRVGKRARTGAGAVVTHDVADGETVVGVPARPIESKNTDSADKER